MLTIYIDADGCPVVDETIAIAEHFSIPVVIVCDYAHHYEESYASVIYCDQGKDHADFQILQKIQKDDMVITQDYGLATLALGKGVQVLSQDGILYTKDNILLLLNQRSDNYKLRRQHIRTKNNKKRSKQQDQAFIASLTTLLQTRLEDTHEY